jgi:hypothetical protein
MISSGLYHFENRVTLKRNTISNWQKCTPITLDWKPIVFEEKVFFMLTKKVLKVCENRLTSEMSVALPSRYLLTLTILSWIQ